MIRAILVDKLLILVRLCMPSSNGSQTFCPSPPKNSQQPRFFPAVLIFLRDFRIFKKHATLRISWTSERRGGLECFWQGSGISKPPVLRSYDSEGSISFWWYWRRLKNHIHIQTYQDGIFDESSSPTCKTAVALNFHQLVALKPSNPVASK